MMVSVIIVVLSVLTSMVVYQVKERLLQDDPMLQYLKQILSPVHPVIEQLKLYRGNKSYTINKEKIFLCLKDENGEYYPLNMLVYVLLHEMAHVLNTEDVGHTERFHQVFDDLLQKAKELGVFNPKIPVINGYCGDHETE